MDIDWNQHAAGWNEDPAVIAYADKACRALTDVIRLDGLRVLDFGCGTGLLTERMAPAAGEIVALDPSSEMIARLNAKALANVRTAEHALTKDLVATNPAFAAKFDLVTASSVCAFVPDLAATLSLLRSLLETGGRFVQWDWESTPGDPDFGFMSAGMTAILSEAGFVNITVTKPFSNAGPEGDQPVLMATAENS